MNKYQVVFYSLGAALVAMLGLSIEAQVNGEESVIAAAMSVGADDSTTLGQAPSEVELIMLPAQTVYQGGSVAYVDFSVDKTFGDCVVVWDADRSLFRHCDDIEAGWQTLYQRAVPAGTDYGDISSREGWNEVFAPGNWS